MSTASIFKGFLGTLALLAFYFGVVSLVSGWNFALEQFRDNWGWIVGLAVGFGIQIGLFTYVRAFHKKISGGTVAATGATSGVAMISCCAHYLVNIVPVIGISGLATVIGQYQTEIFLVGLLANLAGIGYMVKQFFALIHAA